MVEMSFEKAKMLAYSFGYMSAANDKPPVWENDNCFRKFLSNHGDQDPSVYINEWALGYQRRCDDELGIRN